MLDFFLKEKFNVSKSEFFRLFFDDNTFKTKFHKARGDHDVDVSDWISLASRSATNNTTTIGNTLYQRVCFFTIFEQNDTEKLGTRCLETQRKEHKLNSNNEEDIEIYSNIVPENPLGNIFKIEAKWRVVDEGKECTVCIEGMVECNKKMWGVQSYAERLLQQMAMNLHTEWIQLARKQIKEMEIEEAKRRREEERHKLSQSLDDFTRMISLNKEVQRVFLSGTEKVVKYLSSTPQSFLFDDRDPTADERGVEGAYTGGGSSYRIDDDHRKEGCFSAITINSTPVDEHDDSDLLVPERRRTRESRHLYTVIGVVSVLILLCFALLYR